jgi:hypothetical protein
MDSLQSLKGIAADLRHELKAVEEVIASFESTGAHKPGKRVMTAALRCKLSIAGRKHWAAKKKAAATKST